MDPERRAPRFRRNVTLVADTGWTGQVVNLSAVGLRAECERLLPEGSVLHANLHFGGGKPVLLKLKVVWSAVTSRFGNERPEMGLEVMEAAKDFYDQLPSILSEER